MNENQGKPREIGTAERMEELSSFPIQINPFLGVIIKYAIFKAKQSSTKSHVRPKYR